MNEKQEFEKINNQKPFQKHETIRKKFSKIEYHTKSDFKTQNIQK